MSKEPKKTHEIIEEFLNQNNLGGIFAFYDLDTRQAVAGGANVNKEVAEYLFLELKSAFSIRSEEQE